MSLQTSRSPSARQTLWMSLATAAAAFLAGCAAPLPPAPAEPKPEIVPPPVVEAPKEVLPAPTVLSYAKSAREYRKDAASHLYAGNAERIYKGRMPPLLYAVGVLQVEVDPRGMVHRLHWMRAPDHAPEVVAEIERTVRNAQPYPAAVNLGYVTYTDTWLWHKSGRFQLDTLTEGQDGVVPAKVSSTTDKASKVGKPTKPGKPLPVATN